MNNTTVIIWGMTILIFITIIGIERNKKIIFLEKEIKDLMSITASLKLRVFDHEKQILNKDGVYIPKDIGEYYFKQTWALLDDETKKSIEDEYNKVCPNTIPIWKYFLYSYKPKIKVERKIELKKIDSIEELIDLSTGSMEKLQSCIDELEVMTEKYSDTRKEINEKLEGKISKISKEVSEVAEQANSI